MVAHGALAGLVGQGGGGGLWEHIQAQAGGVGGSLTVLQVFQRAKWDIALLAVLVLVACVVLCKLCLDC